MQVQESWTAKPAKKESTRKRAPTTRGDVVLDYRASPDGVDSNLLVLFHGLGDTQTPFTRMGQSLNLPQTAVLSVRGLRRIPYLEEEGWQWWDSFDVLGEMISHPDPSSALRTLGGLLDRLIDECGWPSTSIHLFGFGQGGTLAGELAIRWTRERRAATKDANKDRRQLGSVVSICGPLLSLPTFSPPVETPALVFYRGNARWVEWWKKGFEDVSEARGTMGAGEEMVKGREEWEQVMRFWSEKLRRRSRWELEGEGEGLFEVSTG